MRVSEIKIRRLLQPDLPQFISLCEALEKETTFMLYAANERTRSLAAYRSYFEDQDSHFICIAEHPSSSEFIGYALARRLWPQKRSHTVNLACGVLKEFHSMGLGIHLSKEVLSIAQSMGIKRVECSIMRNNFKSLKLVRSLGLTIEGLKRHSILLGNELVDEFIFGGQL